MALINCPECGKQISDKADACIYCGYPIAKLGGGTAVTATAAVSSAARTAATATPESGKYNVMLSSYGTLLNTTAAEAVSDVCGYSLADALEIMENLPTIVAYNVGRAQAKCVAQVLSAKGMDVSVYDANGYVSFDDETYTTANDTTTTTSSGLKIAGAVAAILATLTAANRFSHGGIRRYDEPYPVEQRPQPRPQYYEQERPQHAAPQMQRPRQYEERNGGGSFGGQGGHGAPGGSGGHGGGPGGNGGPGGRGGPGSSRF